MGRHSGKDGGEVAEQVGEKVGFAYDKRREGRSLYFLGNSIELLIV